MGVDMARNTVYNLIRAPFKWRFFHGRPSVEGPANKAAVPTVKSRGRVVQ